MKEAQAIKKFLKHIGFTVILNLLVKPLGILVEMLVQKKVGHESWGTFAAIFSLGFLLSVLSDMGVNQYYTNQVAKFPEKAKKLFSSLIPLKTVLLLLFPITMVSFAFLMGYRGIEIHLMAVLATVHGLIQFMNFFRGGLQGKQLFAIDAIAQNLHKILLIAFGTTLILSGIISKTNDPNALSYAYAYVICLTLASLFALFMLYRKNGIAKPVLADVNFKQVLIKSFPFALITVFYSLNERLDMVMIERLYSKVEAGQYSAAYRILDAAMMYLWIILPMFFARFSHHYQDLKEQQKMINQGVLITALPLMLFALLMFYFGDYAFIIFKENEGDYQNITHLFHVLSLSLVANGLFAILSTYLTSNGFTKQVNQLLVISILFNGISNWILIPEYGAIAAAWTTLGSTLILSLGYIFIMKMKTEIRLPFGVWLSLISIVGIFLYFIG